MYDVGNRIQFYTTTTSHLPGYILEINNLNELDNIEYVVCQYPDNYLHNIKAKQIYGYWFKKGDRVCDDEMRSGMVTNNVDSVCHVRWDKGCIGEYKAENLYPELKVGKCYWAQTCPDQINENVEIIAINGNDYYCVNFSLYSTELIILNRQQFFFAVGQLKVGDSITFGVNVNELEGKINDNHKIINFKGIIKQITDNIATVVTTEEWDLPISAISVSGRYAIVTQGPNYLLIECMNTGNFMWEVRKLTGQIGEYVKDGVFGKIIKFTYESHISLRQLRYIMSKI